MKGSLGMEGEKGGALAARVSGLGLEGAVLRRGNGVSQGEQLGHCL